VDYAKDNRWLTWNQEALRGFLETTNKPTDENNGTLQSYAGLLQEQFPKQVNIPKSWEKPKYNPEYCIEEKPDIFGMNTLFGSNLEDSTWELASVSQEPVVRHKYILIQQLTHY
jgi:hypothetical protein